MSINCVHMLVDLLFEHITNVSVLLKGEIRCVKNVSIISQFKIPSCEKMQLQSVQKETQAFK